MTNREYIQKTGAKAIVEGSEKEIKSAYAGDFLSFVMGNAGEGSVWFTVMNNVNVAGVAYLAGISCIVLCEGVNPDTDLIDKCQRQDITLVKTSKTVYEACAEFSGL